MNFNLVDFSTYDELPPEIADNLGWISDDLRSDEMKEAHDNNVAEMPSFKIVGDAGPEPEKVFLWDAAKIVNGGKHLPCSKQNIGSCVGHGKYNAERYLACVDIAVRGDNEQFIEIFEPYGYGRSRFHSGISGSGSGSTGSGAAKAATVDGVLPISLDGLSGWDYQGDPVTLNWSADVDTKWSNGARIDEKWLTQGRQHLVRSTAKINNSAEAKTALANGYPLTCASSWGGKMRPTLRENVLLNTHSDSWAHQMSSIGYWVHPVLGLIFWIPNSWGAETHGICPSGAPPGGFWVMAKDMDFMCRDEVFAFSQFDGFPAQKLNFNVIG